MARRQNAWLTPDNGDTTVVGGCLYVPRVLVPMVTGALSALTEQWNWEQVGTMTVDEATQLATVMLLNYELSGCEGALNCDDVIACLLDSGILDDLAGKEYRVVDGVPQWSLDGETWTDFTDEPQPPYASPATVTPGNDDDERICLAATRAVNTINELHRQTWGVIQEGLADIATTFMIRMRDTLTTLISLWYGEVGAVVFGELLRIGAANPANFISQGMTEQEKEDFLCLLLEHATVTNGIVSFDFGAVRDNAVAALGLVIGPDIYLLLQYIQSEGLNAASRVNNAQYGDCSPCEPPAPECNFNLEQGTNLISLGGGYYQMSAVNSFGQYRIRLETDPGAACGASHRFKVLSASINSGGMDRFSYAYLDTFPCQYRSNITTKSLTSYLPITTVGLYIENDGPLTITLQLECLDELGMN